ncbi:thioredoxin-like protein, partial [Rhizodiscina lignyota]
TKFNGQHVPPFPFLNADTIKDAVKEGHWLVEFFSPYCHHCQAFAPVLQTLYEFYYTSHPLGSTTTEDAEALNSFTRYYDFNFAKIDCVANGDLCTEYNVQSYPTMLLIKNGEVTKTHKGQMDLKRASDFVEEILETIKPGSRPKEGVKLPVVGADHVDEDAEIDEPSAKDKDPEAGAAAASKHNEIAATATASETVAKPTPKPPKDVNLEGKSVDLTMDTFQKKVTFTKEPWFVKFYAPWCHHCQALAPNWAEMAREMKGKLNIGEVNCEVEKQLCKNAKIKAFPTLKFLRGGEFVEYEGLRGVGDLISYAEKAVDSGMGVLDVDATEFQNMEETEEVIFTYFYDHATTSEDFAALERLSLQLIGKARLVKTQDKKLAERFKISTWPRLLVSRDGQPTYYTALAPKDMRDVAKVLTWMRSVWLPLVPELTAGNSREIMGGRLVVLGILSRDRADEFGRAKKELKSAALEWMDISKSQFQLERQELRDAKQLKIEEAETKGDEKAEEKAKLIKVDTEKLLNKRKEVGFAWVDGVFWERWIKNIYGVRVEVDGERVIVNDEDRKLYYDHTPNGNAITPSRTSILETLRDITDKSSAHLVSPKSSSAFAFFFNFTRIWTDHPFFTIILLSGIVAGTVYSRRQRRSGFRGTFGGLNGAIGEVEKG